MSKILATYSGYGFENQWLADEDEVPTILKSWDGYIAPDGTFHTTKPSDMDYWNGTYNAHEDFARKILENGLDSFGGKIQGIEMTQEKRKEIEEIAKRRCKRLRNDHWISAKDLLVFGLGWVAVSTIRSLELTTFSIVSDRRGRKILTKAQEETIMAICEARGISDEMTLKILGYE